MVNVVGTVNVFEAVKRRGAGMAPVVYTSSIGMYAADDADPATGRLLADAAAHPHNHYGVYKQANEGNARVYWLDDGVPSIGLRPMTVYGVGRDQGMTSGPTKAIVAAVLGRPYTVSFGGPTLFQYAEDAARLLIAASRSRGAEAHVYNMPGTMADGADLVAAIESTVPDARGLVDFEPVSLPFPVEIDHDGIETHRARAVDLVRRRRAREHRDLPGAGGRGPARRGRARPRGARLDVACLPVRAQTPPSPGGARRPGQGAALPGAELLGAALPAPRAPRGDPPGAALAAAASISPPSAAAVGSPGWSSWPLIASVGVEEMPRLPASPVVVATATTRAESSRQAGKPETSRPAASAIDVSRSRANPPLFSPSWLA